MEPSDTLDHSLTAPRADYDGAWKEAFELFLMGLTILCFPDIADLIDWEAGFDFMDKDLEEIMRDAELGRQHVDKLVKVHLRDGADQLILFHIEIASQEYVDLARTMYQYNHRLEDRFGLPVLSVAVLADDQAAWRPHAFERNVLGCKLRFEFPTCKLLDFRLRWAELEAHPHPAAIIIMAHLRALESRKDMHQRSTFRRELTKLAYEKGFDKKIVLEITRQLDWLLALPQELSLAHRQWVVEYEKEKAMPFVSIFESASRQEGQLVMALRPLRKRFGELDEATQKRLERLPSERLEELSEALLDFTSISDLRTWLQSKA